MKVKLEEIIEAMDMLVAHGNAPFVLEVVAGKFNNLITIWIYSL